MIGVIKPCRDETCVIEEFHQYHGNVTRPCPKCGWGVVKLLDGSGICEHCKTTYEKSKLPEPRDRKTKSAKKESVCARLP